MTVRLARAALLAGGLALGCAEDSAHHGAGEPFRVKGLVNGKLVDADFHRGALPGIPAPADGGAAPMPPPSTGDAASADAAPVGAGPELPELVGFELTNRIAYQGQGDWTVKGSATKRAVSVGISLEGGGDGYWTVPMGTLDERENPTWEAHVDFDEHLDPGFRALRAVALDTSGAAGHQQEKQVCVASRVPDNFTACKPSAGVPLATISLTWDSNVDLDLQVLTPDGVLVNPKNPTTIIPDGSPIGDDVGVMDRDSNGGCRIDGIRTENLVWKKAMPEGRYAMYANLFSACGKPSVRFTMEVYTAELDPEGGTKHNVRWFERSGELLDFQANGGAARGLFVGEFIFH